MPQFLLGQAVRLATGTITNDAGPADPATLALTITLPDLTTIPISLAGFTRISAGVYQYDYLPTQAGHHTWRIVATGPNTAAEGAFDVTGAGQQAVIGLDEAKAHLRITSDTTDDELRLYLSSVTSVIEERVGPVVPRQFTQVVDVAETIVLDKAPVVTVDTVAQTFPNLGALFAVPTYQLEAQTGLLRAVPLYAFNAPDWRLSYGRGVRLTVTYTAGRSPVPAAIQLAARIILEELWSARRAAGPLPARGQDAQQVGVPGGYGLPDSAVELLRPFTRSSRIG